MSRLYKSKSDVCFGTIITTHHDEAELLLSQDFVIYNSHMYSNHNIWDCKVLIS